MKNEQLRHAIADTTLEVLKSHGHNSEIRLQVAALAGSLDDTLSDEFILEELKALKAGDPTFSKVFADNSPKI
jgi:hypothetical protein